MYLAFMRRRAVEHLEARKLAITTGFWANDGMNDDEGTRTDALAELEDHFDDAVNLIYSGKAIEKEEDRLTDEDLENPFLAPAIKATREIETPTSDEATVAEAISSDMDLDQH